MAYVARANDFHGGVVAARPAVRVPRPGLLTRILDAVFDSRRRQAQRDVEIYLARRGNKLTDSIERERGERLFRGDWNGRR